MNSQATIYNYSMEQQNNDTKLLGMLNSTFPNSHIIKYTPQILQFVNAIESIQNSSFTGEVICHVKHNVLSIEGHNNYPIIKPTEQAEVIE